VSVLRLMTSILTEITFVSLKSSIHAHSLNTTAMATHTRYIHCVYAISNIMYNISCVIKSAIWVIMTSPIGLRRLRANRRAIKTISLLVSPKSFLTFRIAAQRRTTIFFIRCYGKKVKVKAFPYSIPSVGPRADPGVGLLAVSPQPGLWCYGKRTILLFYGRFAIPPDNSWQYWSIWESVHSPYRRHCLCRISLVGDWLKFA